MLNRVMASFAAKAYCAVTQTSFIQEIQIWSHLCQRFQYLLQLFITDGHLGLIENPLVCSSNGCAVGVTQVGSEVNLHLSAQEPTNVISRTMNFEGNYFANRLRVSRQYVASEPYEFDGVKVVSQYLLARDGSFTTDPDQCAGSLQWPVRAGSLKYWEPA